MHKDLETLSAFRLIPVIKIDRAGDAVPLCRALKEGGLPVAEITFRTEAAEESIRRVKRELPEILLGAGTVISVEQVKRAVDAGASYIVSPGFSHAVTEYCVKNDIAVLPGAITPTELMYLAEYGLEVAKFFPAEQAGGVAMLKALSGPFPQMRFLPTGGISAKNLPEYLSFPKVVACGGSWMVKDELILKGDFETIRRLVSEAVALTRGRPV
jgi:2-dehydro-3-deoxyphosphogluconate aldolase/(4S)-4-hydroxy-2-oxoglutarate aldolase